VDSSATALAATCHVNHPLSGPPVAKQLQIWPLGQKVWPPLVWFCLFCFLKLLVFLITSNLLALKFDLTRPCLCIGLRCLAMPAATTTRQFVRRSIVLTPIHKINVEIYSWNFHLYLNFYVGHCWQCLCLSWLGCLELLRAKPFSWQCLPHSVLYLSFMEQLYFYFI